MMKINKQEKRKISETAKKNGVGKWMTGRKTGIIPKSAFKIGHLTNKNRKQTKEQIDKRVKKTSKENHYNKIISILNINEEQEIDYNDLLFEYRKLPDHFF